VPPFRSTSTWGGMKFCSSRQVLSTSDLGDEERDLHAGRLVFIPTNTWIALKNTGTDPTSLVAIFSAPGFQDYLRCRSVPASEQGTSISMEGIKDCAHEGNVTFEAFQKNPEN
jgi:oxalate decarboxylase/phosphoglucose isomerase-like protein (cupin superfamily)